MEFFRLGAEEKARFYQKILLEVGRLAPIMLIDADGNFIFASDAFLTDMGLEAEDLRHKSAYDLVAEKYYDRSPSLKALAEGKDCGELSESKDGFPVYTETKLLRNEQGEVEYALCHSLKPASIDHEVELLRHQVAYYRGEVAELKNRLRSGPQTIYQSEAMRRSIVTADRVAKADTAVMLTGESGVGKDLMARHIHERSARSGKPFVPVCIPMMSPSLLESELFGYVEGAFTGSMRKGKTGLFEAANGGTVFLDEVGDIPLELQVKLLRVLENQEIIRVGGTEPTHLDIRIISATNRDIPSMVELPGGPVLPPGGHPASHPAAAGADGRRTAAGGLLPPQTQPEISLSQVSRARCALPDGALRLARECASAPQCGGAVGGPQRRGFYPGAGYLPPDPGRARPAPCLSLRGGDRVLHPSGPRSGGRLRAGCGQ